LGLSHNIRVGTTPGGIDIVSPESDTVTGRRRIPAMGNAQMRTNAFLRLPAGRYYWSVQAVDTGFAGGPWAPEQSFQFGAARFTSITRQPLVGVVVDVVGYTGLTYRVLATTNLPLPNAQWVNLTNFTAGPSGQFEFIDRQATNLTRRFYKAVTP
jgi:hypothetical protein